MKNQGVSIIRWSPIQIPTRPTGINFSERLSCVHLKVFIFYFLFLFFFYGETNAVINLLVTIDHCQVEFGDSQVFLVFITVLYSQEK